MREGLPVAGSLSPAQLVPGCDLRTVAVTQQKFASYVPYKFSGAKEQMGKQILATYKFND